LHFQSYKTVAVFRLCQTNF